MQERKESTSAMTTHLPCVAWYSTRRHEVVDVDDARHRSLHGHGQMSDHEFLPHRNAIRVGERKHCSYLLTTRLHVLELAPDVVDDLVDLHREQHPSIPRIGDPLQIGRQAAF